MVDGGCEERGVKEGRKKEKGGKRGGGGLEEEDGGRRRTEELGRKMEEGIGGKEMNEWKKLVRESLEEAEITESVILMILRRAEEEEGGIVQEGRRRKAV